MHDIKLKMSFILHPLPAISQREKLIPVCCVIENCLSARSARGTIWIMGRKMSEDLIGADPCIQLFKLTLDGSAPLPRHPVQRPSDIFTASSSPTSDQNPCNHDSCNNNKKAI